MGTVQNIMGVLYSCTTFLGMFNMMSVMPILGYERSVMYRSVLLRLLLLELHQLMLNAALTKCTSTASLPQQRTTSC